MADCHTDDAADEDEDRIKTNREGMAKLPQPEDWPEEAIEAAAYADDQGHIPKQATAGDGSVWRLEGPHRINSKSGPVSISNPLTDETEQLYPVHHESANWVRSNKDKLHVTESGYLAVLRQYTQGAGSVGWGLVYAGPYKTAPSEGPLPGPRRVYPMSDD